MKRLVILALMLLTVRGAGGGAQSAVVRQPAATTAADSLLEARTREVASQLRCPVCQGLSLQDSPSELSQEMKDLVREQLRAGKSPAQVKQYFIARYGEWILLEPQAHGFNWLVYVLPLALLLAGGGVVTVAVRRWTSRTPVGESPLPQEDDEATSGAVV
jgi:cytochrome c-type biogenesis protein CcmH